MKRKFLVLFFIFALMLVGCDGLQPPPNFSNEDIVEVVGKEGYYTDESLAFCTEIRGSYKSNRPFNLDENNENLRIWDDVYLYEYDYFQMIASGTGYIYYTVNDEV
ncbi:MAG: hypothetical protein IKC64_04070, partial [Clostridia bacterium]|nr:hypothetical protein [Clostridia bacterium]